MPMGKMSYLFFHRIKKEFIYMGLKEIEVIPLLQKKLR